MCTLYYYTVLPSSLSFLRSGPEVSARSLRTRAFLKSSDLSESSFEGGRLDSDGRPDSDGRLLLLKEGGRSYVRGQDDGAAGSGRDVVVAVHAHFVGGRPEGPARVEYKVRVYVCIPSTRISPPGHFLLPPLRTSY